MGVLFTNNASTTLSAAISSTSATSISVASSSTFPAPGAGEYFYATIDDGTNIEIVKVTAVSGTTWTVVRASDNTSAATFANGTTIQLRTAAALLTDIQQNIAAKSANQTVYNATTASSATTYNVGTDPQNEANAMVFLDGVMQHHDTFSFSGSTLTFDAAPSNGLKLEVIIDNLINLQSSNLTVDTFTATNGQTAFTLSDTPAAEDNLIVFIEGVFQNQDSYSISTNTLTMSAGVTTNRKVVVYIINPVNIGTPSDGTVTSAKLSGNITTPGTLTVGSHDVAFDSPTFVVDNSNSRVGLGTASPSVPVDIVGDVKMSSTLDLTSHLDMPDSANVKLGTGDDLLLYHDGTNSYIANTTGALKIATETSGIAVTIGHTTSETTVADNLTVTGTITGTLATAAQANITSLGTLTALTVDNINVNGNTIKSTDSDGDLIFQGNDGGSTITALTLDMSDAGTATFNHDIILGDNGVIGLGASNDLQIWHDASNSHISNNYGVLYIDQHTNDGNLILRCDDQSGGLAEYISLDGGAGDIYFKAISDIIHQSTSTNSTAGHHIFKSYNTEIMRIDGANNIVGIGTSSPSSFNAGANNLVIGTGSGSEGMTIYGGAESNIFFADGTAGSAAYIGRIEYAHTSDLMRFYVNNTNAMTIISSGNVGIGTSSPSHKIEVSDGAVASKYDADDHVAIRGLSGGQYIQYGSGRPLKFVSVDTYPNSGATVNGQITAGVLQTYNGFSVKKNASTDLSGSAHLDAGVKFAFYQYVVTSTDVSNGYGDVEHKVYRDNYMGHTVALFDASANVVYTGIKADSWITNTDRYASGDITRCFFGSSVAAGDKVRLIVFWHSAYG